MVISTLGCAATNEGINLTRVDLNPGVFDLGSGALIGIVEGYRTARLTLPESHGQSLDLPVAGETTVISVQSVVRFLTTSGLGHLVSGQR